MRIIRDIFDYYRVAEIEPKLSDKEFTGFPLIIIKTLSSLFFLFTLLFSKFEIISSYSFLLINAAAVMIFVFMLYPVNRGNNKSTLYIFTDLIFSLIISLTVVYFSRNIIVLPELYQNLLFGVMVIITLYYKRRETFRAIMIKEIDLIISILGVIILAILFYLVIDNPGILESSSTGDNITWIYIIFSVILIILSLRILKIIRFFMKKEYLEDEEQKQFSLLSILITMLTIIFTVHYLTTSSKIITSLKLSNDYLFDILFILIFLEVCRRVLGAIPGFIVFITLLYTHFGYLLYNVDFLSNYAHKGFSLSFISSNIIGENGILFKYPFRSLFEYVLIFCVIYISLKSSNIIKIAVLLLSKLFDKSKTLFSYVPFFVFQLANSIFPNTTLNLSYFKEHGFVKSKDIKSNSKFNLAVLLTSYSAFFIIPFSGLLLFLYNDFLQLSYFTTIKIFFFPSIAALIILSVILYVLQKKKKILFNSKVYSSLSDEDNKVQWTILLLPVIAAGFIVYQIPPVEIAFYTFLFHVIINTNIKNNIIILPAISLSFFTLIFNKAILTFLSIECLTALIITLLLVVYTLARNNYKKVLFYNSPLLFGMLLFAFTNELNLSVSITILLLAMFQFVHPDYKMMFSRLFDDIFLGIRVFLPIAISLLTLAVFWNTAEMTSWNLKLIEDFTAFINPVSDYLKDTEVLSWFADSNAIMLFIIFFVLFLFIKILNLQLPPISKMFLFFLFLSPFVEMSKLSEELFVQQITIAAASLSFITLYSGRLNTLSLVTEVDKKKLYYLFSVVVLVFVFVSFSFSTVNKDIFNIFECCFEQPLVILETLLFLNGFVMVSFAIMNYLLGRIYFYERLIISVCGLLSIFTPFLFKAGANLVFFILTTYLFMIHYRAKKKKEKKTFNNSYKQ